MWTDPRRRLPENATPAEEEGWDSLCCESLCWEKYELLESWERVLLPLVWAGVGASANILPGWVWGCWGMLGPLWCSGVAS